MCHYLKVRFLALEDQVKPSRLYYLESFQVVTCRSREPYEWSHSKNVELILYLILRLNCWYLLQQIWANDEVPHSCAKCFPFPRVPTRTGKPGKPGKMGRHFPVREKSGNFEQTGKVRENCTKYWKTQGIWDKYYLIFLYIIFSDISMNCVLLLKWIKFSVKKIKH